jgi:hypothetical protein
MSKRIKQDQIKKDFTNKAAMDISKKANEADPPFL